MFKNYSQDTYNNPTCILQETFYAKIDMHPHIEYFMNTMAANYCKAPNLVSQWFQQYYGANFHAKTNAKPWGKAEGNEAKSDITHKLKP